MSEFSTDVNGIISYPSDEEWERLHSFDLKFGDCWKNCDSYCCKTNHPQQEFSLMKKDSAGMVFMPQEYLFLSRHNRLQDGFNKTHRSHKFVFNETRDLFISFDTAICDLGGICSLASYRPMICKMYPYYPVISPESRSIESFITGSLIDQFWDDLGIEHPCWLHRTKSDLVKTAVKGTADTMQHPYYVFYMGAAAIFVDHVTKRCNEEHAELLQEDPRMFFKNWEILYLTQQLIDKNILANDINEFHSRVEKQYGLFSI